MKFFIIFAGVIALVYGEYKISEEFIKTSMEKATEIAENCLKQENASEADLKEFEEKAVPTTRAGKCTLACIYEAFGIQEKDGKFTKEGIVQSLEPYKAEDVELFNALSKVLVEKCLPQIKATDRCEAAVEMANCYLKNASDDMLKVDGTW